MNSAGNQYDRFPLGDQFCGFFLAIRTDQSRVCEFPLDLLVFLQSSQVLGRADRGKDKWPAERCRPNFLKPNAIRAFRQSLEIRGNICPGGKLAVVSGGKPKDFSRSRDGGYRWLNGKISGPGGKLRKGSWKKQGHKKENKS